MMRPLDGDPVVLARTGQRYGETAAAIRSAVRDLRRIAERETMVSLAVDRVRSDARRVANDISAAEERYAATGDALVDYAHALRIAQDDADRAIYDADSASEDMAHVAAEQRYAEAVAARDRAAEVAISRIREIVDGSSVNDSIWDNLSGAFTALVDLLFGALQAIFDAVTAIVRAIVELLAMVLTVVAAIVVLGLAVLAVLAVAALAPAVLAVLLVVAVATVLVVAIVVAGAAVLAVVATLVLLARVLVGLGVLLVGVAFGAIVNLVRGMEPMRALTHATIVSLFVAFPELWAVVAWASRAERGTPELVAESDSPHTFGHAQTFSEMFDDLSDIDDLGNSVGDGSVNEESVIRIVPFHAANGETVYRIHIPSTQQWTPGGTSGNDVTSDIVAKLNPEQRTQLEKMVWNAMERAEIPDGAHVLLAGWSLGGITAGNLAADREFTNTYNLDAVVTAGSSLDDLDIPTSTRVLDVSHAHDPVARSENPFRADHSSDSNRYKVDVAPPPSHAPLGHSSTDYQSTFDTAVDDAASGPAADFRADDPRADDGIQISDYFTTPTDHGRDYSYHRGD